VDVPNYELEAAGLGMWRAGQEELTAPYAERYVAELPGTATVRSGWLLADAAQAFFPITALDDGTLAAVRGLAEQEGLDASLRRSVVDMGDELARRLAVRRAFGG
jgi:aminopeptidase N